MKRDVWNRCDVCGKFIPMGDFDKGAIRHMVTPDSDRSSEEWETLCLKHGLEDRAALKSAERYRAEVDRLNRTTDREIDAALISAGKRDG